MIRKILRLLKIKESHQRYNIYDTVFKFIYVNKVAGNFAEFGTYKGRSAKFAFDSLNHFKRLNLFKKYYFFDSFKGLPDLSAKDLQNNSNNFQKNQYSSSIDIFKKNNKKSLEQISYEIVNGYFEDTLDKVKLADTFSFVHIDVDLYSSCKEVLSFLNDNLSDGAVLLFDDYFCYRGRRDSGVQSAFHEWLFKVQNTYSSQEYYKYSTNGCSFIINTK